MSDVGMQSVGDDPSKAYRIVIVKNIDRMFNHFIDGEEDKFYRSVVACLHMTTKKLPLETRKDLDTDKKKFDKLILSIDEDNSKNESTKKSILNKLRKQYALEKMFYITESLSQFGIDTENKEGLIDFDKLDFDLYSKMIKNSGKGMPSTMKLEGLKNEKGD